MIFESIKTLLGDELTAQVETALRQSGKFIPWQVVTLGRDGNILD